MSGTAVAWVNASPDPQRGTGAAATLRTVLGYFGADVVPDACTHIPLTRDMVDADGVRPTRRRAHPSSSC